MKSKFLKEIITELKSIGPELKEAMGRKNKVEIAVEPVIEEPVIEEVIEDVYEEEPVIEEIYEDEEIVNDIVENEIFEEIKEKPKKPKKYDGDKIFEIVFNTIVIIILAIVGIIQFFFLVLKELFLIAFFLWFAWYLFI